MGERWVAVTQRVINVNCFGLCDSVTCDCHQRIQFPAGVGWTQQLTTPSGMHVMLHPRWFTFTLD